MSGYGNILLVIGAAILAFFIVRDVVLWYFKLSAMERHQWEMVERLRAIEALLAAQAGQATKSAPPAPAPDPARPASPRQPEAGPFARAWVWLQDHF